MKPHRILKVFKLRSISHFTWIGLLVFTNFRYSQNLSEAAIQRTQSDITYDGQYFKLKYPGGDIPSHLGVCTDVLIRSRRTLGIDLQKLVHEDMLSHFNKYPSQRIWGLKRPDKNIDHRRVPNLQVFLTPTEPNSLHPKLPKHTFREI